MRKPIWCSVLLLAVLALAACQTEDHSGESAAATEQAALFEDLMQTAIFETSVVKQLTALVPTPSSTPVPPSLTPEPSLSPTLEPTEYRNPWLLQQECEPFNISLCAEYSISSTVDLHVSLTDKLTGESGFFVIPASTPRTIILLEGTYHASYSGFCEGERSTLNKTWSIRTRTDAFGCQGKNLVFSRTN